MVAILYHHRIEDNQGALRVEEESSCLVNRMCFTAEVNSETVKVVFFKFHDDDNLI